MSGGSLKGTALVLFGRLARTYERALDVATLLQDRRWKSWAVDHSGASGSTRALDVGCGTLLLEERLLGSGASFVGLDITREMLTVAKSKRLPAVEGLFNGDAEALPFEDSSFDLVVSCYVAKYVDLARFVGELARVVKPGGRVVLYDFVRPRGAIAPVLRFYVHGILRGAGLLLGLAGSQAAFTFKNLPRIVESASWDSDLEETARRVGLETLSYERLTGGVVAAYAGVKLDAGLR